MFSNLRGKKKSLLLGKKENDHDFGRTFFFSFILWGGHNKIKCLLSAHYMINTMSIHGT